MPENDPIFNALAGGGNSNSFYAAGQNPQIFMQQPENEQSVPQTVPPVVNANNDNDAVVDDNSADQSGASVGTALNGSEGAGEPPTITIPKRTMTAELPKVTTYQDLIEEMTPYRTLSPKEIQELRKKQKREAIFAAIGDGIAAISNLYFAGKSGFSNFDGKNALSTVSQKRWEKLWDDYKNNQDKMLSFKMRAMGMDDAAAQAQWNREKAVEDAAISDARYNENIEHRNAREAVEDARYNENIEHRNAREVVADDFQQQHIDISRRAANRSSGASTRQGVSIDYGSGTTADGKPMKITLPAADWQANAAGWFALLPEAVRKGVHGDPVTEKDGITGDVKIVHESDGSVKYAPPSIDQKLEAIWEFLGNGKDYMENGERNMAYYIRLVNRIRNFAGLPVDNSHARP